MSDIIMWELRRRRAAIFWWCLGTVVITAVILMLYPSIRNQANQLNQVINQLPQGLRDLKTGGGSSINVADPIAFLNSQLFYATLPIIWIILAVTRGSSALGKEEQSGTLELLLARPISRGRLLGAKLMSYGMEFVFVTLATILTVVIIAPLFSLHVGAWYLIITTIYTALFSATFGLIAFALVAASKLTKRLATAAAVVAGFGGYLLASLSGLTDWLKTPAKLVPYHYFNPQAILKGQEVYGLDVYLVGIFIICITVAYFGFRKRDIS